MRRLKSASFGLRPAVDLCRSGFASAQAGAWRVSAKKADFNQCKRPLAEGIG